MKRLLSLGLSLLFVSAAIAAEPVFEVEKDAIHFSWESEVAEIDHFELFVDIAPMNAESEEFAEVYTVAADKNEFRLYEFQDNMLIEDQDYYFSLAVFTEEAGRENVFENVPVLYKYEEKEYFHFSASEVDFIMENIVQHENGEIEVLFSQPLQLPSKKSFIVTDANGDNVVISNVRQGGSRSLLFVIDDMQQDMEYTVMGTSALENTDGETLSSAYTDSFTFIAQYELMAPEVVQQEESHASGNDDEDTLAPLDVDYVSAKYKYDLTKGQYNVLLNWPKANDLDGDLSHVLYREKTGVFDYTSSVLLKKNSSAYETYLPGGEKYVFKISTVDHSDNESDGKTVEVILPETGPASILLLTILFAFGITTCIRRRG